jgi:MoxR-like ATPase
MGDLNAAEQKKIERLGEVAEKVRVQLRRKIVGLDGVIDDLLIAIFAQGHTLLVGAPGLAKTLLVSSLAQSLSLDFRRIQFTPDLMPSDITGAELIAPDPVTKERKFVFQPGPIFANVVLADEINRTPPKTQAALMEAMEERQVSSGGKKYPLDPPFFVLATQNPIEQEGTYPLPIAQLDRFMFMTNVDYPTADEEYDIVRLTTSGYSATLEPLVTKEEILDLHGLVRKVQLKDDVIRYAMDLVRRSRVRTKDAPPFVREWLSWGAGPRATQFLLLGAKARAMLRGRSDARPGDVRAVAPAVLRHRILPSYHAEAEGVTADDIVSELLETTPAPDGRGSPARKKGLLASLFG